MKKSPCSTGLLDKLLQLAHAIHKGLLQEQEQGVLQVLSYQIHKLQLQCALLSVNAVMVLVQFSLVPIALMKQLFKMLKLSIKMPQVTQLVKHTKNGKQ